MNKISKKIILTGSFCVGKTSLISKFVYKKFPSNYDTTLGVRINRKVVKMSDDTELSMIIWDIGGEQKQSRVPSSYYLGSSGVIYVFDLSRPSSAYNITEDLAFLQEKLPNVPIITVGNKVDLLDDIAIEEVKSQIPITPDFLASAKHGTHVEDIFFKLGQKMI